MHCKTCLVELTYSEVCSFELAKAHDVVGEGGETCTNCLIAELLSSGCTIEDVVERSADFIKKWKEEVH